jgi:hypothetical protein
MDTDPPKVSTAGINMDTSVSGLGLGLWTPFQPSEVLDLRSFTYDSKTDRIMQEQLKKVPTTEGMSNLSCHAHSYNGRCKGKPNSHFYNWFFLYEHQQRQHLEAMPAESRERRENQGA